MSNVKFDCDLFVSNILPNVMKCYNKSVGISDCEKEVYEYAIINPNNDAFQMQQLIFVDVVLGSEKKLSLVIKVMHLGQEYFKNHYENEITMYNEVIPLLGTKSELIFPRCFYTRAPGTSTEQAVLVLQNLSADGYKMSGNKIFLSRDEILLALKTLGKFHGYSYALKIKSRGILTKVVSKIQPTYFENSDNKYPTFRTSFALASSRVLKRFLQIYEDNSSKENLVKKARALLNRMSKENPIDFTKKLMEPKEPLAVLVHRDYNRNNIMYRYADHAQTEPTDCMVIDFQTISYSSPMADFTFLLFMNMRADEERPWDELWDAYHTTLVTTLSKEIGTPRTELPHYFSLSSFKEEFNKYCLASYMITVPFLNITVMGLEKMLFLDIKYEEEKRAYPGEKEKDNFSISEFDHYFFNKMADEFYTDQTIRDVTDSLTIEVLRFYDESVLY